ncbi:MAG TPA: HEAT repeat domain-containing protein [Terriglobia bacterium]|nr:HEAT repeat domain-containing protein [Terriglobia bacterium]
MAGKSLGLEPGPRRARLDSRGALRRQPPILLVALILSLLTPALGLRAQAPFPQTGAGQPPLPNQGPLPPLLQRRLDMQRQQQMEQQQRLQEQRQAQQQQMQLQQQQQQDQQEEQQGQQALPAAPIKQPAPVTLQPGSEPPAGPSLKVDYAGAKLSVTADHVPLSQVLQEIGQKTGLQVHGLGEAGRTVAVQFSGITVAQAVQGLLGGTNYVVFGSLASPVSVRLARVVILNAAAGAAIDMGTEAETGRSAAAQAKHNTWRAQLLSTNPAEQDAGFREVIKLGPKEAYDALTDVIANGDGIARLRALQFMDQDSQIDQSLVMGSLHDALSDQDSVLRDYAVQALGRHPGADSLDLLRQVYSDGDSTVRLNVIEAVSQRTDAHTLLQQAATDPDQAVSSLATELLNGASNNNNDPDQ